MLAIMIGDRIRKMLNFGQCRVETTVEELKDRTPEQLANMIHPNMVQDGYVAVFGSEPNCYIVMRARDVKEDKSHRPEAFSKPSNIPMTETQKQERREQIKKTGGCSTKHCRKGDRECDQYWGCRDTCRVVSERITSMTACPQPKA